MSNVERVPPSLPASGVPTSARACYVGHHQCWTLAHSTWLETRACLNCDLHRPHTEGAPISSGATTPLSTGDLLRATLDRHVLDRGPLDRLFHCELRECCEL